MPPPAKPRPAPHPLAGIYCDCCGSRFVVPAKAEFALYRLDAAGLPLTPESPLQTDAESFRNALGYGTFQKLPPSTQQP